MNVLSGQFEHAIDSKGRIILPKPFREHFQGEGVVSPNELGCLNLWTSSEWTRLMRIAQDSADADATSRRKFRYVMSMTSPVAIDDQGRLLVPPAAKKYAGLESDVLINGVVGHIEIWSPSEWERSIANVEMMFRSAE
jgi:MraZ protein